MAALEILCVCLTILLFIYYYCTAEFNYWKARGVKGPKPVPFFGNIADHLLGKISFGDFLKKIYDAYPKEAMAGVFLRGEPVLVLRDAEYIKRVLIKDFSSFSERHLSVSEKADPMSVHLFRIDSVRWRPLRMRLSPVFTSGKMKDMFHLLLECSEDFEKYLNKAAAGDGILECRELTARYTINVIGVCAFGIDMNALKSENNEFHRIGRRIFRSDLKTLVRIMFRDSLPWLYDKIGRVIDDHDVTNFITKIIKETIDYRREHNIRRNDFVDVLIDLKDHPEKLNTDYVTDTYVAAQMFVFFAAGFETSSTTMSNALYELAQYPAIQDKVREEIKEIIDNNDGIISYDSVKEMSYLDKIFQETLRMYPPVSFLARKAMTDYTFEGTEVSVSKGYKVYIPIYAIQRDPSIYPNPDVFDPERFNDESVQLRDPMNYLPFGTGPRNCIGMRFAGYQAKVGLIKVLSNYKVDVCEKTQIPYINNPKASMMLQPDHGIYLKFTKVD